MKSLKILISILLVFAFSFTVRSQANDFFVGKWNVLVKGLPQGDTKMFFILEKKDAQIVGVLQDATGKQIATLDKVEVNGTTATIYFYAQGYDVNLVLNKKDDDHVTGSMMGMFDAEGERVKQ